MAEETKPTATGEWEGGSSSHRESAVAEDRAAIRVALAAGQLPRFSPKTPGFDPG